tara:strand:- start:263 stop:484 length:222 start_codon:yes stop_codon:yes gene_type:complete
MIFHRITQTINVCPRCKTQDKIQKLLTTPNIKTSVPEDTETEVGEITKEYIEANREILKQQKQEAKEENYEPS